MTFEDQLFPYQLTVLFDPTARHPAFEHVSITLNIVSAVSLITALILFGYISYPIAISIKRAHISISRNTKDEALLDSITFLPLREVARVAHKVKSMAMLEAVVKSTQMLAHDVRKPFSTLRIGLSALSYIENQTDQTRYIEKLELEVDASLKKVDAMLQDVIDAGKINNVKPLPEDIGCILEDCIKELTGGQLNHQVSFEVSLQHKHLPLLDRNKFERVILNILDNAFQAMNKVGRIWIHTKDLKGKKGPMLLLTIGNSNSYIPASHIPKLFDPFFTEGKRSGIGLGLAIAKEIISEHNGTIQCKSESELGVEFYLQLPSSTEQITNPMRLAR